MKLIIDNNIYAYPNSNEIEFVKGNKSEIIAVEPIAMQLLKYLVDKKNEVCTIDELVTNIWDGNENVGKPALRKLIYKLRFILNKYDKKEFIKTIQKKGYRFNSDKNSSLKSKSLKKNSRRLIYTMGIVVIILIIVKIIFPGILYEIWHRLSH